MGAEGDNDRIDLLLCEVSKKDITEVIAVGREKFALRICSFGRCCSNCRSIERRWGWRWSCSSGGETGEGRKGRGEGGIRRRHGFQLVRLSNALLRIDQ
ncbi:hypothetical protein ZIOFF_053468 [Zingiber officinale]|uniref:Uncharacterized protein n=1 Tax=Zingiber officinale TaxID=94328 RepID=A0A8J5FG53_ZINOF|nr:hypothetical protein ZIOFF_053468 [Zingiber officinale]